MKISPLSSLEVGTGHPRFLPSFILSRNRVPVPKRPAASCHSLFNGGRKHNIEIFDISNMSDFLKKRSEIGFLL